MQRHLRRTLETDSAAAGFRASSNRLESLAFALAGIVYMLRFQKNTRIMALATISVVSAGLWLRVDSSSWAVLSLAIALVWISEFVNAAVEAAVNLSMPNQHSLAKTAKDVAAGAVLVASLAAAIVGAFILGPPLLEKLQFAWTPYLGST